MADLSHDWSASVVHAVVSDVGMRRSINQDSHVTELAHSVDLWRQRGHFFAVADGMGAHAAGELASKLAVDNISHAYRKRANLPPDQAIRASIHEANAVIHERGETNIDFQGMGTTCSTLLLLPEGALIAHVGDSRIYRLRSDRIEQLTFDHSLVWELIAAGKFEADQVPDSIPKNVITRSLGPNADVQVDLEGPFPVEPGDAYLLCSDGLTGLVKDDEIGAILGILSPDDAAQTLVDVANLRGGHDNITVLAIRIPDRPIEAYKRAVPPSALRDDGTARNRITPWVWAALAAGMVGFGVALSLGHLTIALASLFGGLLGGGIAARVPQSNPKSTATPQSTQAWALGKGPYRETVRAADESFALVMQASADKAMQQYVGAEMSAVQPELTQIRERAEAARASRDYGQAIVENSGLIRLLSREYLKARRVKPDGSSIDVL